MVLIKRCGRLGPELGAKALRTRKLRIELLRNGLRVKGIGQRVFSFELVRVVLEPVAVVKAGEVMRMGFLRDHKLGATPLERLSCSA